MDRLSAVLHAREMALRILVVDDSATDRLLVRLLLEHATPPQEVLEAESIAAALPRLGQVDCVLLDLQLADAQGLDGLRRITHAAPHLPVVVLTGTGTSFVALQALSHGATRYLVKGKLTVEDLMDAVTAG